MSALAIYIINYLGYNSLLTGLGVFVLRLSKKAFAAAQSFSSPMSSFASVLISLILLADSTNGVKCI